MTLLQCAWSWTISLRPLVPTCGLWSMCCTLIKLTEIEKWGDTDTWIQHVCSAVIAHRLRAAADCFSDQQFAVTRTWDTPKGGTHTEEEMKRCYEIVLNSLSETHSYNERWHSVWKSEKKKIWKWALFRRNQPLKIASLERHSKLNTQTLQGSCLKMLCTQPINSNLLIETASLNCSVC